MAEFKSWKTGIIHNIMLKCWNDVHLRVLNFEIPGLICGMPHASDWTSTSWLASTRSWMDKPVDQLSHSLARAPGLETNDRTCNQSTIPAWKNGINVLPLFARFKASNMVSVPEAQKRLRLDIRSECKPWNINNVCKRMCYWNTFRVFCLLKGMFQQERATDCVPKPNVSCS